METCKETDPGESAAGSHEHWEKEKIGGVQKAPAITCTLNPH